MRKIILASTSPRRKEILSKTGLAFDTEAPGYEEDMTLALPPEELVQTLSRGKAESVAKKHAEEDVIVIGSDTFITLGDEKLGKPKTADMARQMLRKLSGKMHQVLTGLAVIEVKTGRKFSDVGRADVYFKELGEQEIEDYVATGEPLMRAAGYAIQGGGKDFVERYEGDYDSIVGLPLSKLTAILGQLEVNLGKNLN